MSKTSEDRAKIPEWLTKTYLQEILRGKYSADLEVKSFTAEPPVAAGNNYASLILRVKAQCLIGKLEKEESLIVKTVHFNEESAKKMEEYDVHAKEMKMYSSILPRVHKVLETIGDTEKISPLALYVDDEHQTMIFEDMKCQNYILADRMVGLDLNHMRIITRKHAKLHACSMILAEQGEKFENFQKGKCISK